MRTSKLVALGLLLASTTAWGAPPPDLDATVAKAMAAFDVPGAAVSIVEDGKIVLTKGYGVRGLGDKRPVDENTLFAIGSCSKAFTAALVATLVDQGKMSWDDKIIDRVPEFRLPDAYAASTATVKDALAHRTGLGQGEGDMLMFPQSKLTRLELLKRVRFMPVKLSFRDKFAYNNLGFVAAGEAAANAAGTSWENALRSYVLKPIGIDGLAITSAEYDKSDNKAQQHMRPDDVLHTGKMQLIPSQPLDNGAPAGALSLSAVHLAKWVQVQLADGALPDGKRVWSEARTQEMRTIVTPTGAISPTGEGGAPAMQGGYAQGWSIREIDGHVVVTHGGGVLGSVANVAFIPDLKVGFTVTVSTGEGDALGAISQTLFDYYLKKPAVDQVAKAQAAQAARVKKAAEILEKAKPVRDANAKPPADADSFAGTWRDAWFGDVTVARNGAGMTVKAEVAVDLGGTLEFWQHDTYIAHWTNKAIPEAYVTFVRGKDGSVESMKMAAVSPIADFSFAQSYLDMNFKRAK
ncbi:MAG: beta-lactamase [Rhodospirillales bacterium]|jgi:CubicO group peptidase (beta-lactamase class C family)|nr:beta-lactamase [Rhodospirillales bacterium]